MTGYTTLWCRPGPEDYHYAGPYGTGNGSSYANAIAGLKNVPWTTPKLQVIVADVHVKIWTGVGTVSTHGKVPTQNGTIDYPTIVRGDAKKFDAAANDGVVCGGMIDKYSPAWVAQGGNVWKRTSSRFSFSMGTWSFYITGNETTVDQVQMLVAKQTLAECQAQENTTFLEVAGNPHTIYIHLPAGVDPQTNYITPSYGYGFYSTSRTILYRLQFFPGGLSNTTYYEVRRCKLITGNYIINFTGDKPGNIIDRCQLSYGTSGVYVFSVQGPPLQVSNNIRVTGTLITDIGGEWFNEQISDAHAIAARHGIDDYYIDGCKTIRTGHPIVMYNYWWSKKCRKVVVKRTVCCDPHTHYRWPDWNGIALNPADTYVGPGWEGFLTDGNVVERCYVEASGFDYAIRNGVTVFYDVNNPDEVYRCINNQVDNGQYGLCLANAVANYPVELCSTGYLRGNVVRWPTRAFLMQLGGTATRKNYARNGGTDSDNNTFIVGSTPPTSDVRFGASLITFAQWKAESPRFDPNSVKIG